MQVSVADGQLRLSTSGLELGLTHIGPDRFSADMPGGAVPLMVSLTRDAEGEVAYLHASRRAYKRQEPTATESRSR